MSTEARLKRLGVWHLKDNPEELLAALNEKAKPDKKAQEYRKHQAEKAMNEYAQMPKSSPEEFTAQCERLKREAPTPLEILSPKEQHYHAMIDRYVDACIAGDESLIAEIDANPEWREMNGMEILEQKTPDIAAQAVADIDTVSMENFGKTENKNAQIGNQSQQENEGMGMRLVLANPISKLVDLNRDGKIERFLVWPLWCSGIVALVYEFCTGYGVSGYVLSAEEMIATIGYCLAMSAIGNTIHEKVPLNENRWLLSAVVILPIIFAGTVWPTVYRYDHTHWNKNNYVTRINRLSGVAEMYHPSSGWTKTQ